MLLQVGFYTIVEQAVWWHSLWLSRVHQSILTSCLFKCVLKWTSHGLTFIFMRELLDRHYLKNNQGTCKSSYFEWNSYLICSQKYHSTISLIYELFYISFSHAIIKRIFKFVPIVPSYLIVHTVQTFWPSIFHKQGSFFM